MSETALIPSIGIRVLVGDRSLSDIAAVELVPAPIMEAAEAMVERSEVIEIVSSVTAQENAVKRLKELSTFEKQQVEACAADIAPFKAATLKRGMVLDLILKDVLREKARIKVLLETFGRQQAEKAEQERTRQKAETDRIKREADELERKKKEAEAEAARKAKEAAERVAKEKREAEEKAERERKAAEDVAARLKKEREEAEARGTAEQMAAARRKEQEAKDKAALEESDRIKAQQEADRKAQEEATKLAAETKRQQETLNLQQAELNTAIATASQAVEAPKVAGLAGGFKWKAKPADESNPEAIEACMRQAFAARPDFFELKPRIRVIEAALKEVDGKMEIAGFTIYKDFQVRNT